MRDFQMLIGFIIWLDNRRFVGLGFDYRQGSMDFNREIGRMLKFIFFTKEFIIYKNVHQNLPPRGLKNEQ